MIDKLKEINEEIKKEDVIVISHHIGPDLDALGSSLALELSLKLSYPQKRIVAVGASPKRFSNLPKIVNLKEIDKDPIYDNSLLIVLDTPNIERIDITDIKRFKKVIKMDHHPLIDIMGELEYINISSSSASEIVADFIMVNELVMNEDIAKYLFMGIITDTNRFLYSTTPKVLRLVAFLLDKYYLNLKEIYDNIYNRPLKELKVEGYIFDHFNISENGLASIILRDEELKRLEISPALPGNLIGNFNNINEIIVWMIATEDVNSKIYKVNIRSRGPIINQIAEKYHGGGHMLASGARVPNLEDVNQLIEELEEVCKEYKK